MPFRSGLLRQGNTRSEGDRAGAKRARRAVRARSRRHSCRLRPARNRSFVGENLRRIFVALEARASRREASQKAKARRLTRFVRPLRVGFAGTPDFAARILAALIEAQHTIPVCLTQPDRPKGRGMRPIASPVKRLAEHHGLPVFQPATLKTVEARAPVVALPLDVLIVAAYGLILPQSVLDWPRYGCLNVHASLLPRWRGAAPIERAIEAGDTKTGITIMQMDAGLDTGAIVATSEILIDARETAGSLTKKLAGVGAKIIVEVLARLAGEGSLTETPQSPEGVSYARKIEPHEALVEWQQTAAAIERKIRAYDPAPVS